MLAMPISSPQMMRMFGLRPRWSGRRCGRSRRSLLRLRQRAGGHRRCRHQRRRAEQDIAAAGGAVFGLVRRALRVGPAPSVSSGILGSFFTVRTDNYSAAGVLFTQRNPTWLVEVSIGSACRAAGR